MRIPILVFIWVMVLIGFAFSEELETTTQQNIPNVPDVANDRSSHHVEDPKYQGFWKKKFVFQPRWVKTWQEKKVYVAVWKRVWGPVEVKEWVPVPKPPPGWVNPNLGASFVKALH